MATKLDTKAKRVCCVINFKDEKQQENIRQRLEVFCSKGLIYYAILHDRDIKREDTETGIVEYKTLHYHLVLCGTYSMRISTWLNTIRDTLNVDMEQISIEVCNDFINSVQYLIHQNNKDKVQYDYHEILTCDSIDSLNAILTQTHEKEISIPYLKLLYYECDGNRMQMMSTIGLGRFHSMRATILDIWNMLDLEKKQFLALQGYSQILTDSKHKGE